MIIKNSFWSFVPGFVAILTTTASTITTVAASQQPLPSSQKIVTVKYLPIRDALLITNVALSEKSVKKLDLETLPPQITVKEQQIPLYQNVPAAHLPDLGGSLFIVYDAGKIPLGVYASHKHHISSPRLTPEKLMLFDRMIDALQNWLTPPPKTETPPLIPPRTVPKQPQLEQPKQVPPLPIEMGPKGIPLPPKIPGRKTPPQIVPRKLPTTPQRGAPLSPEVLTGAKLKPATERAKQPQVTQELTPSEIFALKLAARKKAMGSDEDETETWDE